MKLLQLLIPIFPAYRHWLFAGALLLGCSHTLPGQDIHFSQFQNAPQNLNPALAGVFEGDQRLIANYRNQWASVPVPYLTFSAAYDQKFYFPWLRNGLFGAGILFNYDVAGDADMSWTQIALNLSYSHQLSEEHFVTAGFQFQNGQRAFKPQLLNFDDQFNGDIFDPSLPSGEVFTNTSTGFLSMGTGINWFFRDLDSRTTIKGGGSYFHFNKPEVGLLQDASVSLAALGNIYGIADLEIHDDMDLQIRALAQVQGAYKELVIGSGIKYHLNQEAGNELALSLGAAYRMSDAIIAQIELYYKNWLFGISYDINTSPFSVATNRNGGPEIALQYILFKVQPPETFKACPIF